LAWTATVGLPVNIAASISRADLQDQPRAAVLVGFGLWVPLLPAVSGGRPRYGGPWLHADLARSSVP
jgi:hypothetical protein